MQAGYGGAVVAGSTFAVLQSLGMTVGAGALFPALGGTIIGSAIAAGGVSLSPEASRWCAEKSQATKKWCVGTSQKVYMFCAGQWKYTKNE